MQIRQMAPPGNSWVDCNTEDEEVKFVKVQLKSGHVHQQIVRVGLPIPPPFHCGFLSGFFITGWEKSHNAECGGLVASWYFKYSKAGRNADLLGPKALVIIWSNRHNHTAQMQCRYGCSSD